MAVQMAQWLTHEPIVLGLDPAVTSQVRPALLLTQLSGSDGRKEKKYKHEERKEEGEREYL